MQPKEPVTTEAMVEACWRAWVAMVIVIASALLASAAVPMLRALPPEAYLQNCPPLLPDTASYGPFCF